MFILIPIIITIILIIMMIRPLDGNIDMSLMGIQAALRLLWLIPMLITWTIFFAIMWMKS